MRMKISFQILGVLPLKFYSRKNFEFRKFALYRKYLHINGENRTEVSTQPTGSHHAGLWHAFYLNLSCMWYL